METCDKCERPLRTVCVVYAQVDGRRTYIGVYGRKCLRMTLVALRGIGVTPEVIRFHG
jgi:hypothetical protein